MKGHFHKIYMIIRIFAPLASTLDGLCVLI